MNKQIGITLILILALLPVFATHERAGDITYRHISGLTYEINLVTYTYSVSPADRPSMTIDFGDGTSDDVMRYRQDYLGNFINCNYYTCRHTYPSSGSYTISTEDPDRNQGIVNIPNSVNIPFYIETTITINNFLVPNNSPVLTNPPIEFGCVGSPFYYNPVAIDPDGDSLSYSLVACRGTNGDTIPGYSLPIAANYIRIDAVTGDLEWDYPMAQGEYNIAILIQEYRKGVKISSIIRDMQITITACDNRPPNIDCVLDTCIDAGDYLHFDVTATDNPSQIITLSAMSEIFTLPHPARFSTLSGTSPVTNQLEWYTSCEHVRKQPYLVTFKARDNGQPISLTKTLTASITVVSPAPQQLQAHGFENSIALSWQPSPCHAHAKGYKIYRRVNASGYIPSHCQTGVPKETGYTLIATVGTDTSYIDDNKGKGLLHATEYCYMVTAFFADGGESYASNEACNMLINTVPVITNVSITTTHYDSGTIDIQWLIPKDIDSIQYPKPYTISLYGSLQDTNQFQPLLNNTDTQYFHTLQNTVENQFYYKIALWDSNQFLIGYSDISSSIYLSADAGDKNVHLYWAAATPWTNYNYIIQQYDSTSGNYMDIDSTGDTNITIYNLYNEQNYAFRIKSFGSYSDTAIAAPLINYSQTIYITPIDRQAPPCPDMEGNTDCENVYLQWNVDDSITDICYYYIHYKPDNNSPYIKLDSIPYPENTYRLLHPVSVIGCFAVSAIDSNGNESDRCSQICFDTDLCSRYRLPNIFTPNGSCEGSPCLFRPYEYNFVESIQLTIYNRWGDIVFQTQNPDILWDGNNTLGKPCSDGVYYYVCDVYEYSLQGIIKRNLSGSITIIR